MHRQTDSSHFYDYHQYNGITEFSELTLKFTEENKYF